MIKNRVSRPLIQHCGVDVGISIIRMGFGGTYSGLTTKGYKRTSWLIMLPNSHIPQNEITTSGSGFLKTPNREPQTLNPRNPNSVRRGRRSV